MPLMWHSSLRSEASPTGGGRVTGAQRSAVLCALVRRGRAVWPSTWVSAVAQERSQEGTATRRARALHRRARHLAPRPLDAALRRPVDAADQNGTKSEARPPDPAVLGGGVGVGLMRGAGGGWARRAAPGRSTRSDALCPGGGGGTKALQLGQRSAKAGVRSQTITAQYTVPVAACLRGLARRRKPSRQGGVQVPDHRKDPLLSNDGQSRSAQPWPLRYMVDFRCIGGDCETTAATAAGPSTSIKST